MSRKKEAEDAYSDYLKDIIDAMGSKETDSAQLKAAGKTLFGSSFRGVFASDTIPNLKNNDKAIVNVDKSGQAGSHWIGLYKSSQGVLVYDSFGRKSTSIIPSVMSGGNGAVNDTEYDAEQADSQENCGQRVLAFLACCHVLGANTARYI